MARRGVWIFILLVSAIGASVMFAAFRLSVPASPVSSSTVLVFDVPAELEEADLPTHPLGFDLFRRNRLTVARVVEGLRRAARDPHVSALVLHVDELDWGWGKISEVRDALQRFRDAGKPVYASLTSPSDSEYLLASPATRITMPPTGLLQLDGLTQSVMFFKGTFDKVDIRPNFAHAGKFKSAVESYTRTGMSPEAREALTGVLDDTFGLLVDSLAATRGLTREGALQVLDEGPYDAAEAWEAGLVDSLVYDAELDSMAANEVASDAALVPFAQYASHARGAHGPKIALIGAVGTITGGRSRYDANEGPIAGSETLIQALEEARTNGSIRAVVLRIDSPGGDIVAADDVWRAVTRLAKEKVVVASMSDLAASGGYYIAAGAHRIVAQPATLTGSIGVFGGKLNVLGLYRKLGLNVESVSRGRHAEMLSPFTDFDAEEARRYGERLDASYRIFLQKVADGRGMSLETVDSLGQGRIWSGIDAWQEGLVDTLGGLDTAFDLALSVSGASRSRGYRIEVLPKVERSWLDRMLGDWFNQDPGFPPLLPLPAAVRAWIAAARFPRGASLALMPYSIEMR